MQVNRENRLLGMPCNLWCFHLHCTGLATTLVNRTAETENWLPLMRTTAYLFEFFFRLTYVVLYLPRIWLWAKIMMVEIQHAFRRFSPHCFELWVTEVEDSFACVQ
jgi:hypothetical protein